MPNNPMLIWFGRRLNCAGLWNSAVAALMGKATTFPTIAPSETPSAGFVSPLAPAFDGLTVLMISTHKIERHKHFPATTFVILIFLISPVNFVGLQRFELH